MENFRVNSNQNEREVNQKESVLGRNKIKINKKKKVLPESKLEFQIKQESTELQLGVIFC